MIKQSSEPSALKRLFSPLAVNGINLKNRVVMPAMTTNFAYRDGGVSPRLKRYYQARAAGGAGLVIVEPACVDYPRGKGLINQLDISSDTVLDGLKNLASAIKSAGACAALQLHHAGSLRLLAEPIAEPPLAPSSLGYRGFDTPAAAEPDQIRELVAFFAAAALRAQKAGFEAVEFHGAHSYLISQFLSPLSNRRTDQYGGSCENRLRFFTEIITATRELVGQRFPIICRINGDEYREGGLTIDDSCAIARELETAGADAINVSIDNTPPKSQREVMSNVPPMGFADATWVHLAAAVKQAVTIPVIAVGRIHTPELAEDILSQGKADLIAVGRGLIADPDWPAKAAQGDYDAIRPCITCNTCIREVTRRKSDAVCAVNPAAGREEMLALSPAHTPKRILVIGGGPAGLATAWVGAQRGHQVQIWEKGDRLGGQLNVAAVPWGKSRIHRLVAFYSHHAVLAGVKVRLNAEWQDEEIKKLDPHTVVVAAGSRVVMPFPPGADHSNVVTAREVLAETASCAGRVVIVGGGAVGCETADVLIQRGYTVTLIEQKAVVALEMDIIRRRVLMNRLDEGQCEIRLKTRLLAFTATGLTVAGFDGTTENLTADTIVLATEPQANREILTRVKPLVKETFVIGDALRPRGIQEAIQEGWMVGLRL